MLNFPPVNKLGYHYNICSELSHNIPTIICAQNKLIQQCLINTLLDSPEQALCSRNRKQKRQLTNLLL